jgi:GTP-binding protein HflX
MEFYNTTMSVLADLGANTKQMLVVFNKVDKISDPSALFALRRHFPDAASVSALTGEGMNELVERISEFVARGSMTVELRLPNARADLLARLHREGTVHTVHCDNDFTTVAATLPHRALEVFAEFRALPVCDPLLEALPESIIHLPAGNPAK